MPRLLFLLKAFSLKPCLLFLLVPRLRQRHGILATFEDSCMFKRYTLAPEL